MAELQTYKARPLGVIYDVSPANADPGFYNGARNIVFHDDRAERQHGYIYRQNPPVVKPEACIYRSYLETDQFLYAGVDGIGIDVVSQYDITPPSYPLSPRLGLHGWAKLNGIPVWNHPDFTPHYHGGDFQVAMQPIPAWPAGWYANRVVAHKFHLLALGGGDSGGDIDDQMRWSSSADPGLLPAAWMPAADNDAGDLILSDTPGAILDAVPLGDNLIAYKASGAYFIEYLGGIFVFGQRKLFSTTGILAAGCAAEWRGMHYVVTQGDIIQHNGSAAQGIADAAVQRAIFDDIDGTLIERAFAYIDPYDLTFNFCWPSRNAVGWCDRRASYKPSTQKWSIEELAPDELACATVGRYTRTDVGGTWDGNLTAWDDASGSWDDSADPSIGDQILESFPDVQQFGEPTTGGPRGNAPGVDSELIWGGKDLGQPTRRKIVDRVWINSESPGGAPLSIEVGWQENYADPISWGPAKAFIAGSQSPLSILSSGRLMALRVKGVDTKGYSIRGFDIDFRDAGPW